jgi:hypothetical protein
LKQSGALNEEFIYQPGHTIHDGYAEYKAAARRAGEDSVVYKKKARELKAIDAHEQEEHKQLGGCLVVR